ncbi:MAG: glycosyltransferase [Desulfovibrio sp.]
MAHKKIFSIITPTIGKRPRALAQCIASVTEAINWGGFSPDDVEMLIGYDGVKDNGRVPYPEYVKSFNLPRDNDWGNGIRQTLLRAAKGERILFLDDDNVLTRNALRIYQRHFDVEMIIGRVDTSRAFDIPWLPVVNPGDSHQQVVRHTNIDPLCVCLTRDLVVDRCGGWLFQGKYEADYLNIVHWHRRAKSVRVLSDTVGVYDYGRCLDAMSLNRRQATLLDRKIVERHAPMRHIST